MAKIQTVSVHSLIVEGHNYFKIIKVDDSKYDDFGRLQLNMVTPKGQKHTKHFSFLTKEGKVNEGAQRAWSFWVGTILGKWGAGEVDTDELVGRYFEAYVEHVESEIINEETGKPYINVKLKKMAAASGFPKNEELYDDLDIV